MVGNTETTILGYGDLKVKLTYSLDGSTFPLKNVAYCPRFYINLISAERAASAGIYLNGKNCTLEESNGTPICRLNAKSGIYLIKWDESTALSVNHTTLSSPIAHLALNTALYDTASYDTASYDTASYDTASYDTALYDTASYDTTSSCQPNSQDLGGGTPTHSLNATIKDISSSISHHKAYKLVNSLDQAAQLPSYNISRINHDHQSNCP
jgi:hypothetical protein